MTTFTTFTDFSYQWRVERLNPGGEVRYISTFDPRTDEFDVFSLWFDTPEAAVEFAEEFFDDGIPDDFVLIHYATTGTVVPLPA
jgi:hypothetical protein